MTQALYRKYRSKTLDEIVGQDHVTSVLTRALSAGVSAHAYLLTGPRGVGKTSIARILAHEINHLPYSDESQHLDIIEIDAASNNGVDDVRELRDKAQVAPSSAEKKIYIIDEVHMLSKSAFNALLKILEEPPEHVIFILATTDFDKLPDTIVSRTQRYHFHLISTEQVRAQLSYIAKQENISIDPEALDVLAQRGGGSMRDSTSLLDQVQHISSDTITAEMVERALGMATKSDIAQLIAAVAEGDASQVIAGLQKAEIEGISAPTLASQLSTYVRSQLALQPSLVHILEGLSEVGKSSHPDIKLAVTLLETVVPKAIVTPAPIASHQATPIKSKRPAQPATRAPQATANKSGPVASRQQKDVLAAIAQPVETTPPNPSGFDWQAILAYTKERYMVVYTMLLKCTPVLDGDKLILYAGKKFNKTKLDDAKYRPVIAQILRETGAGDLEIETIGSTPPPKDSQAAKIAAMMGGGEEVDVT